MSISDKQALSDLDLFVATMIPPVSAPPVSAPPVSAPPVSAPPVSAPPVSAPPVSAPPVSAPPVSPILNASESKKRSTEAESKDNKKSDKRLKVAPDAQVAKVAQVAPNTQVATNIPDKPSRRTFTIKISNNQKIIYFSTEMTYEIEKMITSHLRDGISVFKYGNNSLNEAFDKAFENTIRFLNIMNIKSTVLTIDANSGIVTDTAGFHITFDFFGSNGTLFLCRFPKMTIIDTFEKQVIFEIKKCIAEHACVFAENTQSLVDFAEADNRQAKSDLDTAQENVTQAKSDLDTAQENVTQAKSVLNTAQENVTQVKSVLNTAQTQKNTIMAIRIMALGVDSLQKNVTMAQEKLAAAQKNVITAQKKLDTTHANAILTKNKASYAAKDYEKKTKDANNVENSIKGIDKVYIQKMDKMILFKCK
jgi:hypothetical protein